jgi:prolyl oligopeptidase
MKLTYPPSRAVDQVDDYHGTLVRDPYRWLEDVDSPETRQWVQEQNRLSFGFLEKIPARAVLRKRLRELSDYSRAGVYERRRGRYFQLRNTGLQNQDALYVSEGLQGSPRLLLDPNTLSSDGTVALASWEPSPDGKWLAYSLASSGSDWQTFRVRSVDNAADLPERIEWVKFSGASWLPDSSGFFYSGYDAPLAGQELQQANYHQKLHLHRLDTPQAQDELVYERHDQKEWGFGAQVSEDGRWQVLYVSLGTDVRNQLYYRDLVGGGSFVELIDKFEASYFFIGSDGPLFYLFTNLDAPRGRLLAVDVTRPQRENWRTLIPEGEGVIESIRMVGGQFVAVFNRDAHHEIRRYSLEGQLLGEVALPALGTVGLNYEAVVHGLREHDEFFFNFSSFLYPPTIHRYDFHTDKCEVVFRPPLPFDPSGYETRQVFVTSKDGTRIPLFLTHRKGLRLDGQNPTLLYGYGGFSVSLLPLFSVATLAWLEMGGVHAQAVLRGGNEYGEEWHQGGTFQNKQNVFDDFIACAEWLIREKVTSTPRLGISGRSNGGLLVGACLTQRPDLFGACLPAVGVMDMLRFHKFTIGWAWVSDYGCADDPVQFKYIHAYSPLQNLRPGTVYPPTLITTADHDDRVVPGHSFKFAAAMQAAQSGDAPVLIRIQTKSGHGGGKPISIWIEETADVYAFLAQALGM